MSNATRVSPRDVKKDIDQGSGPLLVCAYDDPDKCRDMKLPGSIALEELQKREDKLSKDQSLVFY